MDEKNFDNQFYYSLYPDVQAAVEKKQFKSGYEHFIKHGKGEGRQSKFKNLIQSPREIYSWINELITMPNPIIFEVGANHGTDTVRLAGIKGATVHAFEPEPRCDLSEMPRNVKVNKVAVSNTKGIAVFNLSDSEGHVWTYSSSLLKPKNHLTAHDYVKFNKTVNVPTIRLDDYCKENKIDYIDFLYMDVQGAEHLVFEGAKEILKKTKYIYTEYSDFEMYTGQKKLEDLLVQLENYFVMDIWETEPSNVLLQNIDLLK